MGTACNTYGEVERFIEGFGGKPDGKRILQRHRRRWEDIKMDLQEVGWRAWTELSWLRIGTGDGHL
jgi:hypothetical protein